MLTAPCARAGVLADVGVEVPVLCKLQGGAMPEQAGSLSPASWVTGSGEPGPKGRRLGPSGSVSPR